MRCDLLQSRNHDRPGQDRQHARVLHRLERGIADELEARTVRVNGTTLAQAHDQNELASELAHLRSVWFGLRDPDVHQWCWRGALQAMLGRRASLYETGPLRQVLAQHLDPPRVAASPIRLRVGYVDLLSGRYRTAGNDHPALVDAVLASCALPVVFPPVALRDGRELGVDGGVRHVTPLADAMRELAREPTTGDELDEVWVLVPEPLGRVRRSAVSHWLSVALRSLCRPTDILPDTAATRRYVTLHALHPRKPLRGGRSIVAGCQPLA